MKQSLVKIALLSALLLGLASAAFQQQSTRRRLKKSKKKSSSSSKQNVVEMIDSVWTETGVSTVAAMKGSMKKKNKGTTSSSSTTTTDCYKPNKKSNKQDSLCQEYVNTPATVASAQEEDAIASTTIITSSTTTTSTAAIDRRLACANIAQAQVPLTTGDSVTDARLNLVFSVSPVDRSDHSVISDQVKNWLQQFVAVSMSNCVEFTARRLQSKRENILGTLFADGIITGYGVCPQNDLCVKTSFDFSVLHDQDLSMEELSAIVTEAVRAQITNANGIANLNGLAIASITSASTPILMEPGTVQVPGLVAATVDGTEGETVVDETSVTEGETVVDGAIVTEGETVVDETSVAEGETLVEATNTEAVEATDPASVGITNVSGVTGSDAETVPETTDTTSIETTDNVDTLQVVDGGVGANETTDTLPVENLLVETENVTESSDNVDNTTAESTVDSSPVDSDAIDIDAIVQDIIDDSIANSVNEQANNAGEPSDSSELTNGGDEDNSENDSTIGEEEKDSNIPSDLFASSNESTADEIDDTPILQTNSSGVVVNNRAIGTTASAGTAAASAELYKSGNSGPGAGTIVGATVGGLIVLLIALVAVQNRRRHYNENVLPLTEKLTDKDMEREEEEEIYSSNGSLAKTATTSSPQPSSPARMADYVDAEFEPNIIETTISRDDIDAEMQRSRSNGSSTRPMPTPHLVLAPTSFDETERSKSSSQKKRQIEFVKTSGSGSTSSQSLPTDASRMYPTNDTVDL